MANLSFFFFKQKTAYELRISDWSSDVCSSDLFTCRLPPQAAKAARVVETQHLARVERDIDMIVRPHWCVAGQHAQRVPHAQMPQRAPAGAVHQQLLRAPTHCRAALQIGSAHVRTPDTNAQLVSRLLLANTIF